MKTETIKKQIKRKFGKISRFAALAGLNRYDLQKKFARKDLDEREGGKLARLIDVTRVQPISGEIQPEKLARLKTALNEFGGVLKFVTENPDFSRDSVNQILAGRRRRVSPVVLKLFEHFKIK